MDSGPLQTAFLARKSSQIIDWINGFKDLNWDNKKDLGVQESSFQLISKYCKPEKIFVHPVPLRARPLLFTYYLGISGRTLPSRNQGQLYHATIGLARQARKNEPSEDLSEEEIVIVCQFLNEGICSLISPTTTAASVEGIVAVGLNAAISRYKRAWMSNKENNIINEMMLQMCQFMDEDQMLHELKLDYKYELDLLRKKNEPFIWNELRYVVLEKTLNNLRTLHSLRFDLKQKYGDKAELRLEEEMKKIIAEAKVIGNEGVSRYVEGDVHEYEIEAARNLLSK